MESKKHLTIVILLVALLQIMASSIVSPTLSKTAKEFSEAGIVLIQMIMTLPSICIIIVGLFTAKLTEKFNKRNLVLLGLVLYVAGGFGGAFAADIKHLLGCRIVLGIGLGLITPLVPILIADFYSGLNRTKMMGYSQASNFMGGVIGTVAAGAAATFNWRYAYFVYLLGLVVFVAAIFGLKEPGIKVAEKQAANKNILKEKYRLPFDSYILAILMLLNMFAFFSAPLFMSMFLPTIGINNPAFTGYAVGVLYFANFLPGTVLTKIWGIFKKSTIAVALASLGLGFILLSYAHSFGMVLLGMILLGVGSGTIVPSIFARVPEVVRGPGIPMTMSMINSALYLGMFMTPVTGLIGAMLHNTTLSFSFKILAVLEFIAMVVAIVCSYAVKRKTEKVNSQLNN